MLGARRVSCFQSALNPSSLVSWIHAVPCVDPGCSYPTLSLSVSAPAIVRALRPGPGSLWRHLCVELLAAAAAAFALLPVSESSAPSLPFTPQLQDCACSRSDRASKDHDLPVAYALISIDCRLIARRP